MHRSAGAAFVAAFALIASTASSAAAQRDRDARRPRAIERQAIDTSFRMERGGLVDLELTSGNITVTGASGNQVTIRASAEDGYVVLRASPTLTTVRAEHDHGHAKNVRYEVSVPAGVRVVMEAMSGNLIARGIDGDVDATTLSGNVELRDITGITKVEVLSGAITASGLRRGIQVEATSGPVTVSNADGEIIVENTSGPITLTDVRSRLVRVETVSGNLRFDGPLDPTGRYEFETHSGTIRLALPTDASAQLTLSTFSGSIDTEFPITFGPRGNESEKRLEFKLGNGGARITAETFSGSIFLTRGTARNRQE